MMYLLKKNELNKLMFRKGIDRQELVDKAGISIDTLNSWMYRGTMATQDKAIKVSDCLDVCIDVLFDEVF